MIPKLLAFIFAGFFCFALTASLLMSIAFPDTFRGSLGIALVAAFTLVSALITSQAETAAKAWQYLLVLAAMVSLGLPVAGLAGGERLLNVLSSIAAESGSADTSNLGSVTVESLVIGLGVAGVISAFFCFGGAFIARVRSRAGAKSHV